ncbi:MAG: hypothetical protein E7488_07800 [Ruminococcaceae bacterium]|nr:hypothetical protein [Oscillospiraceae bacterium]
MSNNPVSRLYYSFYHKRIRPFMDNLRSAEISLSDLLLAQMHNGEFCHYDIVIKYMVLEHEFNNLYPDIWKTYHTLQLCDDEPYAQMRIAQFRDVIASLKEKGYIPTKRLSVDKDLLVRDGSHRTAMAVFFDAPSVDVLFHSVPYEAEKRISEYHSCPFSEEERTLIEEQLSRLIDKANIPINIVLLGSCCDEAGEACRLLADYGEVVDCQQYHPGEVNCYNLCRDLLDAANLYGEKQDTKVSIKNSRVAVIRLKLAFPFITTADNNEIKLLKRFINYRIPVIKQAGQIKSLLAEKTFIKDSQLFIPQNFSQNSKFADILDKYLK